MRTPSSPRGAQGVQPSTDGGRRAKRALPPSSIDESIISAKKRLCCDPISGSFASIKIGMVLGWFAPNPSENREQIRLETLDDKQIDHPIYLQIHGDLLSHHH